LINPGTNTWRTNNMRTAYLLVAYKQPNHLARLIRILDGAECTFFIHIDAKVDDTIFKESVGQRDNIVFSRRRWKINWGGSTLVDAMLGLISEALTYEPSFHRFCLLSDFDFPIKSNHQIVTDFDSTMEFMRVDRMLGSSRDNVHDNFVRSYWFNDSWCGSLKTLSGHVRRLPHKEIGRLYHGSAWWALTRDCIEYIVQFLSTHNGYRSFFNYSNCAVEIVFQSIVKQSPFAARLSHDFEKESNQTEYFLSNEHGCHYIDWSEERDGHPKVLDLEDLHKLLSSRSLFARKFDEKQSAQLITRLENVLSPRTAEGLVG
jgi:hypothetical protein